MTKKYDVVVVGAGPAGAMAAKTAGENGLKVALVERKKDIGSIGRSCCMMLLVMNEYYFGERMGINTRDGRLNFPVNGFNIKLHGGYKDLYAYHIYAPNGHRVTLGDADHERKQENPHRIALVHDKGALVQGLVEEAARAGVDVFDGTNVTNIKKKKNGVSVITDKDTLNATFVIAADGVNSRIADSMGFNKDREFLGLFLVYGTTFSGLKGFDPNAFSQILYGMPDPAFIGISPLAGQDGFHVVAIGLDPAINLEKTMKRVMTKSTFAPWFKDARVIGHHAAVEKLYSPIYEPYKDNVLLAGDACWTQEAENTGCLMVGWRAAHSVTEALLEGNISREGVQSYLDWWKRSYCDAYNYASYIKNFILSYLMTSEDLDYFLNHFKKPFPGKLNAYTTFDVLGAELPNVLPKMAVERPTIIPKILAFNMAPINVLFADQIKAAQAILNA
ncbi:MAG: FAD-dependent monooxygenase [Proteobacteria bacterium]|nr:FAD-dependent monooxygenase [Pseudomonadota bacterium]